MTVIRPAIALAALAALTCLPLLIGRSEAGSRPAAVSKVKGAVLQNGARLFVNCASCHTLDADGEPGVGPNLWSIFGAAAASKPDFAYSAALRQSGITWNDVTLDRWLTDPKALVPDNKMAFIGLKSDADRKAVIAYIRLKTTPQ